MGRPALALLLAVAGCAGKTIDAGSDLLPDGGARLRPGDSRSPGGTDPTGGGSGLDPMRIAKIDGVWRGQIRDLSPRHSDALRLVFQAQLNAPASGIVTFGAASRPAPPSRADAVYPPEFVVATDETLPFAFLVEGFPFSMLDGRVSGPRVQFALSAQEPWVGWCSLQTAFFWPVTWPDPGGGSDGGSALRVPEQPHFACVPPGAGRVGELCTIAPSQERIDCGWLDLCSMNDAWYTLCTCGFDGCKAQLDRNLRFDLRFTEREARGSISTPYSTELYEITLSRPD